jgi:tetratricopeptide (TPR) repeat protein
MALVLSSRKSLREGDARLDQRLTARRFSFIFHRNRSWYSWSGDRVPLPSSTGSPSLIGQVIVFTGRLASLSRKDAHALVERLGGITSEEVTTRTTLLVLGGTGGTSGKPAAPAQAEDSEKTRKLRKAEQVNAAGLGAVRITTEEEFCDMAGLPAPEVLTQQSHGLRDVLGMYPGVREDHLRYLAKWGLVRPLGRTGAGASFPFADLCVIRQLQGDLARGVPFRAALRSLVAARAGQLTLDFRGADTQQAKVLPLERPVRSDPSERRPPATVGDPDRQAAVGVFAEAFSLDDGDPAHQDVALAAYRRALMLDPTLVPALVNLANIHYSREARIEAQAIYERAIRLDPQCYEAHFNLGHVFHDLGRFGDAEVCYRDTIALNPAYADAHFYLAVTLEKTGRSQDAKPHWRAYQQLAPAGEWVELAREFSE